MDSGNAHLRSQLFELIGGWPTRQLPEVRSLGTTIADGQCVESLQLKVFDAVDGDHPHVIPARMVRPLGEGPFPAVLYCHAHGHRYDIGKDELTTPRSSLPEGPYGPALATLGIASLCIDLECFGERAFLGGPANAFKSDGARDRASNLTGNATGNPANAPALDPATESAAVKRRFWRGDTLFGAMLRDLAHALDYLSARSDIRADRLATLGLSMGSTQAWWLAALDTRVCAVAQLCCLADLKTLIDLDIHDRHGHYLTVPGLLQIASTAEIAAMIAPRPHLACIGALDPLTPPAAYEPVIEHLQDTYHALNVSENFKCVVSPDTAHVETPEMRAVVLKFLSNLLL